MPYTQRFLTQYCRSTVTGKNFTGNNFCKDVSTSVFFRRPGDEKRLQQHLNILKVEIDFRCNVLGQYSILYFEEQPHIMMKQKI